MLQVRGELPPTGPPSHVSPCVLPSSRIRSAPRRGQNPKQNGPETERFVSCVLP
jgi:hypothetical protein